MHPRVSAPTPPEGTNEQMKAEGPMDPNENVNEDDARVPFPTYRPCSLLDANKGRIVQTAIQYVLEASPYRVLMEPSVQVEFLAKNFVNPENSAGVIKHMIDYLWTTYSNIKGDQVPDYRTAFEYTARAGVFCYLAYDELLKPGGADAVTVEEVTVEEVMLLATKWMNAPSG